MVHLDALDLVDIRHGHVHTRADRSLVNVSDLITHARDSIHTQGLLADENVHVLPPILVVRLLQEMIRENLEM